MFHSCPLGGREKREESVNGTGATRSEELKHAGGGKKTASIFLKEVFRISGGKGGKEEKTNNSRREKRSEFLRRRPPERGPRGKKGTGANHQIQKRKRREFEKTH